LTTLIEFQAFTLSRCADDTAGSLTGVKAHLTKAVVDINPGTTLAELTAVEADYTGYAATVLVWDVPSVDGAGNVQAVSHTITFRPTDAVAPNQIYALFITDGAGAVLYFANQFTEAPIDMSSALKQIVLTVIYYPATNSIAIVIL